MQAHRWHLSSIAFATLALATFVAPILGSRAQGQSSQFGKTSPPIFGALGASRQPANPFRAMTGTYAPNHKTPDGRLCIGVHPTTHNQAANPKIIEHIVMVENICGQPIRVQVCYADSRDCINLALAGHQRLQRILGISSNSRAFRYEYRELY